MDHSYRYIASLTREPFLFYEMRSTAKLMAEGNSDDAIVKEIVEQNLFQYPTEKSITRMAKACIKRLHALEDDSLVSAIASQPTDVKFQVKTVRSETGYVLVKKDKFDISDKELFMILIRLTDGQHPAMYIIPTSAWENVTKTGFVSRQYDGLKSAPEYGINLSKKNLVQLEEYELEKFINKIQ